MGKRDGRGSLRGNVRIHQCTSLTGILLAILLGLSDLYSKLRDSKLICSYFLGGSVMTLY